MNEERKYTLDEILKAFGRCNDTYIPADILIAKLTKPPITFADGEVIAFERGSTLQHGLYETFKLDGDLTYCRKLTQTEVGPDWRPAAAVDSLLTFVKWAATTPNLQNIVRGEAKLVWEDYDSAIDPDKEV